MHDIPVWFLVLSLIFPRLVLFFSWLNGAIPPNTIPFGLEVVMTIFLPRILVLVYIGTNMGCSNVWFIVHCIVAVLAYGVGGTMQSKRGK
jgi:hypothetical protein